MDKMPVKIEEQNSTIFGDTEVVSWDGYLASYGLLSVGDEPIEKFAKGAIEVFDDGRFRMNKVDTNDIKWWYTVPKDVYFSNKVKLSEDKPSKYVTVRGRATKIGPYLVFYSSVMRSVLREHVSFKYNELIDEAIALTNA